MEIVPKTSQHKEALSLVQHARDVIKQEPYYPEDGDMVWCVFDRDDNADEKLKAAEGLAEQLGYSIAYSNPSFELWFLLHFRDQQAELADADAVISILREEGYIPSYEKSIQATVVHRLRKHRTCSSLRVPSSQYSRARKMLER